jgi:hypothetical protein
VQPLLYKCTVHILDDLFFITAEDWNPDPDPWASDADQKNQEKARGSATLTISVSLPGQ